MRLVIVLLMGLLLSSTSLYALDTGSPPYRLAGMVKDSLSQPLESVSVGLFSLPDSAFVSGTYTKEDGTFEFKDLKAGKYYVNAQLVGFRSENSEAVQFSEESPSESGSISMILASIETNLKDVTIVGKLNHSLIQQKGNETVVNVENSVLGSGTTILEVLKRTPGVMVDKDGGIKLKGRGGIMLMIDGRPVYMGEDQIAQMLKSMSSDQVKEIQILTGVGAKFDAAGGSGVINIRLKSNAYEGFNGSVNAGLSQGFYPKANIGTNLSWRKKKFSLNTNYQYHYRKNLTHWDNKRTNYDQGVSTMNTKSFYVDPENHHNLNVMVNYGFNRYNNLRLSILTNGAVVTPYGKPSSELSLNGEQRDTLYYTNDRATKTSNYFNTTLDYRHIFDTLGTEISFTGGLTRYNPRTVQSLYSNQSDQNGVISPLTYRFNGDFPVTVFLQAYQTDFSKPIFAKIKLEAGLKCVLAQTNSERSVQIEFTEKTDLQQKFSYRENILAGYLQFERRWKKAKVEIGGRLERTMGKGEVNNNQYTFTRDYANFFPSANLSYDLTPKVNLALNYTKKLDRPHYSSLNPYPEINDRFSSIVGNPNLLPQFTDHLELNVTLWQGKLVLGAQVARVSQAMNRVFLISPDGQSVAFTTINLDRKEFAGLSASFQSDITDWWTASLFAFGFRNHIVGNIGFGSFTNGQTSWLMNGTNIFKLPYQFTAEISGNYHAPMAWGAMNYNANWQLSAGIQKKMLNNKATLRLTVTDIFWASYWKGKGTAGNTLAEDVFRMDTRIAQMTFSYQFGKRFTPVPNKEGPIIDKVQGGRG